MFAPPATNLFLPSCPHCGTSLKPLWHRIHNNRNAAVLALFALVALTAGILFPFISMSQLGEERIFSLLGGIRELFDRDHLFLACILLIFSVIFPYAKLIALLIATSRLTYLSDRARHRLHKIAQFTGRYSLLDILVVAIIIVVVKFQDLAEARALPGTYLFALPGSPGACRDAWEGILVHQLDNRFRPCNFVELMPRLNEHLSR